MRCTQNPIKHLSKLWANDNIEKLSQRGFSEYGCIENLENSL